VTKEKIVEKQITPTPSTVKGRFAWPCQRRHGQQRGGPAHECLRRALPRGQGQDRLSGGGLFERIYAQAAAGNLADVVWTGDSLTLPFVSNNVLKDLMPFIDVDAEFDLDDLVPVMAALARWRPSRACGGLPASLDVVTMYYNKTAWNRQVPSCPPQIGPGMTLLRRGCWSPRKRMPLATPRSGCWTTPPGTGGPRCSPGRGLWRRCDGQGREKVHLVLTREPGRPGKVRLAVDPAQDRRACGHRLGGVWAFQMGRAVAFTHIAGLRKHFRDTIKDKFEWDARCCPRCRMASIAPAWEPMAWRSLTRPRCRNRHGIHQSPQPATTQLIMAKNMLGIRCSSPSPTMSAGLAR